MRPLYDFFCESNTIADIKDALTALIWFPLKDGVYIKLYEDLIADWFNAQFAVSFGAGRHALYSLLRGYGIGVGDEVILQAFTCVVVPRAIMYAGAKPVYVDIANFNMDLNKLEAQITDKTKAIIVQHTFGYLADIWKVKGIIGNRNIKIIEDCAHCFKQLEGDAAFISTDHTKVISTCIGGVAITNSFIINERLKNTNVKHLSYFRIIQIVFTFIIEILLTRPKFYRIGIWIRKVLNRLRIFYFFRDENKLVKPSNYPVKFPNALAYIGIKQIINGRLEENLECRKVKGLSLLREPLSKTFSKLYKNLEYIIIGCWFNSPVFGCKDLKTVKYKLGSCFHAEFVAKHICNLPTFWKVKQYL